LLARLDAIKKAFSIAAPGPAPTYLNGINDKGVMVGAVEDSSHAHAVVFEALGRIVTYDFSGNYTDFEDVNNKGVIVGYSDDGARVHALIVRATHSGGE
jgi:hypothetical protein